MKNVTNLSLLSTICAGQFPSELTAYPSFWPHTCLISNKIIFIKKLLLISLLFSFSLAWSQKSIVVAGIIVNNNYDEYLTDHFSDSVFNRTFFETFENSLRKKLGDIKMIYPNGKKITFMDFRLASSFNEAVGPYQDYYRELIAAKKLDYDYIVEVRSEIAGVYRGRENSIKIDSKIILKDTKGRSIVRQTGKVIAVTPPLAFNGDLMINRVELKQNFFLSVTDLQDAFKKSVSLAFEESNKLTISAAERPTVNNYDSFTNKAIAYRLLAPANFAKTRFKLKLQGFYTLTKNRPILVSQIGSTRSGFLNFIETKITDIAFGVGVENVHRSYRAQRNFKIGIDMPDISNSNYFIKGVVYADNSVVLGTGARGPVKLLIKRKDEKENGVLTFRNENPTNNPLSYYNRSLGRVFCPFGKMEGTISGKQLLVQSSMVSLNTLEVLINGKLVGLITHPVTTPEYLKKNKNFIPFIVYIAPQLTLEDESLVLQAFQFNRLSYLLKDYQDRIVNSLKHKKP